MRRLKKTIANAQQESTKLDSSVTEILGTIASENSLQPKALLFISESVEDKDILSAPLSNDIEVFVLNDDTDGLHQIAEIVATKKGVSAAHIVSHGSVGTLSLGLDTTNSNALTLETVAKLTGADIAASTDETGSVNLEADWDL